MMAEQRPCQGNTLFLSAGEKGALVADLGKITVGKFGDEFVGAGKSRGMFDLLQARPGLAIGNVLRDGTGKFTGSWGTYPTPVRRLGKSSSS